jgi:hypothetical protein
MVSFIGGENHRPSQLTDKLYHIYSIYGFWLIFGIFKLFIYFIILVIKLAEHHHLILKYLYQASKVSNDVYIFSWYQFWFWFDKILNLFWQWYFLCSFFYLLFQYFCRGPNHRPSQLTDKLYHIMFYRLHLAMSGVRTHNVSGDLHRWL